MNKAEFMWQLEQLLIDIPQYERIEALNYYEEYFSDAGVENEQKVLVELGSPEKVAQTIREGLQTEGKNTVNHQNMYAQNAYAQNTYGTPTAQTKEKSSLPTWAIVLIVIACVFGSPIILGLVAVAFGVLVAIFGGLFGVIVGFGAAGVAMIAAAIALIVAGFMNFVISPTASVILIGAALLIFAIAILCIMFVVWLCGFAIPAICKGIASLFRKPTKKTIE